MDIRLNARLSAYSKTDACKPSGCSTDVVTNEEIDSLFDTSTTTPPVVNTKTPSDVVSFEEIDSLFQ